jgi:hypothetical protein
MANRTGAQDSRSIRETGGGRPRPGGGLFGTLGRVVTQHPWLVIGVWIVAAVLVIATHPALPTTSNEASFLPSSYESIRAQNLTALVGNRAWWPGHTAERPAADPAAQLTQQGRS